jgi:hypothetical protein
MNTEKNPKEAQGAQLGRTAGLRPWPPVLKYL